MSFNPEHIPTEHRRLVTLVTLIRTQTIYGVISHAQTGRL
jgi:hypothetical protein